MRPQFLPAGCQPEERAALFLCHGGTAHTREIQIADCYLKCCARCIFYLAPQGKEITLEDKRYVNI